MPTPLPRPLNKAAIEAALNQLNQPLAPNQYWQCRQGKLHKQFTFRHFVDAFGFMTKVAIVAEKLNHHPEWHNVYNKVTVDLITHDVNSVTQLDIMLAEKIDKLCQYDDIKPSNCYRQ